MATRRSQWFEVQERACSTRIFRKENASMLPGLLAAIADPFMKGHYVGHRVCHHSRTACCRGFWNRFKNRFTVGQLAQRLGLVKFVRHDTLADRSASKVLPAANRKSIIPIASPKQKG